MPALKNPSIPHSDVPHVYYHSTTGSWHLKASRQSVQYDGGYFATQEEAEAAAPAWTATLPPMAWVA